MARNGKDFLNHLFKARVIGYFIEKEEKIKIKKGREEVLEIIKSTNSLNFINFSIWLVGTLKESPNIFGKSYLVKQGCGGDWYSKVWSGWQGKELFIIMALHVGARTAW